MVHRDDAIPALTNLLLFGDNPSGEVFAVQADQLPAGGQDTIRRVLFIFQGDGVSKTLLQLIQEKNRGQSRSPATRADLRFGTGPEGRIFLLNKRDGVIRLAGALTGELRHRGFVFWIRVPADFGNKELVRTLTSNRQTERASAVLKHPAWLRGHRISSSPVGTLAGGTIPFIRA